MSTPGQLPAVVVLISGEGTNLQALIDSAHDGRLKARVAAAISDRGDARGLDRARRAGVEAIHLGRRGFADRDAYERALADAIDAFAPAAVVLAGFMRVLGPGFVRRFDGRMLNIHPSLLPRHRGLDTHRRVLEAGDREHGATVHFVTDELDAGPAVIQYRLPVRPGDSVETLVERVHRGEHVILPRATDWLVTGRLRLEGGEVVLDGERLAGPVVVEEAS
ncbi:MAG TPA: phosphoribosylglycinamide formyltransferase [Gammaproteobacteria bacterium]